MFIFFLLSQSAQSADSLFLASLCPSINGADFKRMFTSRCLCTFCLLAFARSPLLELQVSFYLQRGSNNFPVALNCTSYLSYTKMVAIRGFSEKIKRKMRKFSLFLRNFVSFCFAKNKMRKNNAKISQKNIRKFREKIMREFREKVMQKISRTFCKNKWKLICKKRKFLEKYRNFKY